MQLDISEARTPGLLRRLGAMLYDLVLLLGILLVSVALVVIPYGMILGQPFPHQDPIHRALLRILLLVAGGGFFVLFWARGGQTLGMRAWHLRLLRDDGRPLCPRDALSRLAWAVISLAPAGAGFLWMLIDRDRLTWHDRLSHTRPVVVQRSGAAR